MKAKYINPRALSTAEIARFNPDQIQAYEKSLKYYRDLKNVIDTSFGKGKMEGRMEGRIEGKIEGQNERAVEIARQLKLNGVPADIISKSTGLSADEIEKL